MLWFANIIPITVKNRMCKNILKIIFCGREIAFQSFIIPSLNFPPDFFISLFGLDHITTNTTLHETETTTSH